MLNVRVYIDTPYNTILLPIVERDEVFVFDGEEAAAVKSLIRESSFECFVFLEVLVDFDCAVISAASIGMRILVTLICRPD